MTSMPRIAYLPDSFHEINGVAHTSRNFQAFAERHQIPMLCVRAALPAASSSNGSRPPGVVHGRQGSVQTLDLARSRAAIRMEKDLSFDPLFFRHAALVEQAMRAFQPDIIHITGPSELGILGAYLAWKLHLPLAASWHTNVHEYAARRIGWLTRRLGQAGPPIELGVEHATLEATARFYRLARVLYAPNQELCTLLERTTGRPCHLMPRGVDAVLFSPARRTRTAPYGCPDGHPNDEIVLGYVGRLSVEKNVELLPKIDAALRSRGTPARAIRWEIVGHGEEESTLRRNLPASTRFRGVLRGETLAAAYADMDLFIFPSHTDTFGNVVLEALASGVPAIVTPDGGPKFIVREGETGLIRPDDGFAEGISSLVEQPEHLAAMRQQARRDALSYSWDPVFERVISAYPVPAFHPA
jgi:phosphatidylinositol alpha 1,6-mannosyltransferase